MNRRNFIVRTLSTLTGFLGISNISKGIELLENTSKSTNIYENICAINYLLFNAKFEVFCNGNLITKREEVGWDLVNLFKNPSSTTTFGDLIVDYANQMDLTGSAFIWMVPNVLGIPYELYLIPTFKVSPKPIIDSNFNSYWKIETESGDIEIPTSHMIKIEMPNPIYHSHSIPYCNQLIFDKKDIRSIIRFNLAPKCKLISSYFTKYLALFFGKNLTVKISISEDVMI